jgi:hypothetical protein
VLLCQWCAAFMPHAAQLLQHHCAQGRNVADR